MGITFTGVTGRLLYGSRQVASFTEWVLTDLPGQRRGRLRANFARLSAIYWGPTAGLVVVLDLGSGRSLRGVGKVEATEPLDLIVEDIHGD